MAISGGAGTALANVIEQSIIQDIEPGLFDSLLKVDPVFTDMFRSSFRVMVDPRGLGRNFVIQRVFKTGESGAGHWDTANRGDLMDISGTAAPTGARIFGTPKLYPSHSEYAMSERVTRQIELVRWNSNVFLDESVLLANELRATVADLVADEILGSANKFVRSLAQSFYAENSQGSSNDIDNVVATIGSVVSDGGTSSDVVTVTLSSGQVQQFAVGDFVEIYDATGTSRRHSAAGQALTAGADWAVVDAVDRVGKTIKIQNHGGNDWDETIVATDVIISMRDPTLTSEDISDNSTAGKPLKPYGLNDWILSSGNLFGENAKETSISLATYPQFKSITASVGDYLTEIKLNQFYARAWNAFHGQVELDTAITSVGSIIGYLAGQDGQYQLQRQNMVAQTKAGWKGFSYTDGATGKEITVRISPWVEKGTWFSLQTGGGNLKLYTPPPLPGAQSDSRFGRFARFANLGSGSIFKNYHVSSQTSQLREAPWHAYVQMVPDQVLGMKLNGITELD